MARRATLLTALLLAAGAARAQSPLPASPPVSAEALEAARALFFEGYAAGQQGQWETAYARFSRAMAIRSSPALRFNLALAARNTGRLVEALDQFRAFLRETPEGADAARREAAQAEIEQATARVARLRVEVRGDEVRSFQLDGRAQSAALLGVDIPVDPGPHTVDIEGVAGDRQRREGALFEGERMRVEVELSRDALTIRPGSASAPRSQGFGHWVTRPGPDGRWVDWAAQAVPETPRTVWDARPFTVALQLGLGTASGSLSVSARYFPRPWFGAEVALGAVGPFQPGFALLAHARYATASSRHAFGLFAGPAVALASLTLTCPAGTQCARAEQSERSLAALSFVAGLSSEWRLGSRLALRATAGFRAIVNPADFRALEDRAVFSQCASSGAIGWGATACDLYEGAADLPVDPFVAMDLGYTF